MVYFQSGSWSGGRTVKVLCTCTLHVQRIACVCTQRFGYDYDVPIPVLWEPCNRKGSPFTLNSVSKLSPKKDLLKPAMCLKGYMYGGMSRIQPLLTYVSSFPNFSDPNPNFRYPNFSYLNLHLSKLQLSEWNASLSFILPMYGT